MVMELPNETRYTSPLTAKPAAPEAEVAESAPAASEPSPEAAATPASAGGAGGCSCMGATNHLRNSSKCLEVHDMAWTLYSNRSLLERSRRCFIS